MNQHLQNILNTIAGDTNLSEEQKNAIIKSLKNADKELEIAIFKLDRTEKVKKTTAILLEETIEELEQKRKSVEAQNKELEIESALEKVRSRSLAMQKSDELKEVIQVVYDQLISLNVNTEHAGFVIDYKLRDDRVIWVASKHGVPSRETFRNLSILNLTLF